MGRQVAITRVSSKGQVVIPAALRRRLDLKTGQPLTVRAGKGDEIILVPLDREVDAVDDMLRRLRAAATAVGRDLVEELHERRRRERAIEARKHDRRSH